MRKSTWMAQLERALSREGMTGTEKRTVLNYYEEMYQDRLDDGAEEEDIIKEFGFPEDVAQSVRESDYISAKDDGRKANIYGDYREDNDIPVGKRVFNYDVEANGYSQPIPQYAAPNAPSAPAGAEPANNSAPSQSIFRTTVYIIVTIALFAAGVGIAICGVAIIIAAFVAIAFSIGVWLMAFGVGLIVLAIGCLIICSAVKLVKSEFNSHKGGVK